ncbi:outer membrane protein assembly factor BamA [Aggregatibacter segnis]|jgi:outer membrane protein assembly complex, yaeT protein|uniref:Outer membrane protein assembly factor BamA n=1 Tax=Aggregatibacter segnis ATCC 33393 TaxID=888057 RepID=E6KVT7_9PAST|nr:outer membrane protein assembly factor BamA [Aggregatibacter segnis]EFU68396.1 protective surface antigen D15 [Aggregatibacter segnis ATCC 33393]QQB09971.1 outer membrane protein assembly factor BamA [Aggregatibacter segnis]SQH64254.1 Omp85 [Aggregatibacter segnis ATCC 33393]
MKKLLLVSLLFGSTAALAGPFVVQDIRVDGVQAGRESQIIASLPIKIGQKINDANISNIVRNLFLTGQYDDVRASQQGNTLVISVTPKAIISDVVFEGNKSVPNDALKQNLDTNGFRKGDMLNREKLEEFRKGLEEHYHSVGRYNAKVETIVNPLPNNRAEVKIQVTENDVALLKDITFVGNQAFDSDRLEDQMELQPDAWWKFFGNKFDSTQFTKDLETIRNYYLDRGYAKAGIANTDVKLNDEKTEARVTIDIVEGEKYTVNSARIVGDVGGMAEQLAPLLKQIHVGEEFRRSDVLLVEESIKATLGERGYGSAQVNVQPDFNDENKTVGLSFVVDAGKRYSVRQIRFEGNTVSADSTLRQEMRQQEGSWLSTDLVELGKVRLDRTGFFETVESRTEAVEGTNDQVDVIYKVKERNTGSINFGIGYGTESGLSYQASIKQDNFLGMGSSLSLAGSRNDYGTSVNLGYTEPYFTKDGVSLGGNVFFESFDNSKNSTSAAYARTTYGGNLTLGFPVNENNAYYLGVGYAYNKLKNITPEYNRALYLASMNFDDWVFKSHDYDVSFGWNYNSLNRGFLPTKGVKASIGGKVTIPGSDNKYYRLNADVQGFYPLNRDQTWVLSGRLGASYADGFGGKRLPFYQTYTAGGIGSLRGFSYGAIGPQAIYAKTPISAACRGVSTTPSCYNDDKLNGDVVGGNAMATASVELIVPTPFVAEKNQNSVRTSFFVDAASVWDTHWKSEKGKFNSNLPDYGDPSRVRASAGISFQWQSPIGPLVFSYAKPIKKYENDDIEQFQFSIGGSF